MKENQMDELIRETAKNMILENEGYIEKDIMEESVKEIDNLSKTKETNKKRVKKGA